MLTNDLDNHRSVLLFAVKIQAQGTILQQSCFEEWIAAQLDVVDAVQVYLAAQSQYFTLLRGGGEKPLVDANEVLVSLGRAQDHLRDAHNRAEDASTRLLEVTKDWLREESS